MLLTSSDVNKVTGIENASSSSTFSPTSMFSPRHIDSVV
uniref:Uncharacterized protein n=1 Tax=Ciona savignyi TaxID=51511 RepID=H2YQ45_CIOSA